MTETFLSRVRMVTETDRVSCGTRSGAPGNRVTRYTREVGTG